MSDVTNGMSGENNKSGKKNCNYLPGTYIFYETEGGERILADYGVSTFGMEIVGTSLLTELICGKDSMRLHLGELAKRAEEDYPDVNAIKPVPSDCDVAEVQRKHNNDIYVWTYREGKTELEAEYNGTHLFTANRRNAKSWRYLVHHSGKLEAFLSFDAKHKEYRQKSLPEVYQILGVLVYHNKLSEKILDYLTEKDLSAPNAFRNLIRYPSEHNQKILKKLKKLQKEVRVLRIHDLDIRLREYICSPPLNVSDFDSVADYSLACEEQAYVQSLINLYGLDHAAEEIFKMCEKTERKLYWKEHGEEEKERERQEKEKEDQEKARRIEEQKELDEKFAKLFASQDAAKDSDE